MTVMYFRAKEIYCSASKSLFTYIQGVNQTLSVSNKEDTNLRVEEKAVHAPRERLHSPVQMVVGGGLRQNTTVLLPKVMQMFFVLFLSVVNPYSTGDHCVKLLVDIMDGCAIRRTGRDADIEADSNASKFSYRLI
jgi:hypothetical protein